MKKGIAVALVLVLVGGAGAGAYYYFVYRDSGAASGSRVSSDSEDAVYVDSVSMLAGLGLGSSLIQRYAGVVEPQQTWEVKLENERTVAECYVKEGDEVTAGQRLFAYDTADDEDKLAQAQIDLERCQNDIETATATKEQLEKEKARASSDDQLSYTTRILAEENTIKQSEYEYKSKELEIKTLQENISDAVVYCDIDGVVKAINDPNDTSSMSDSSSSAYIQVLEMGDYRVKGTVNEQNINQITEGMEVIVHSRVDDTVWHGMISEINRDNGETNSDSYNYFGSSSDSSTSSTNYPFYVELDHSDGMILGQHVYVEPDMGQGEEKEGIWLDDYYFTIEEDGSAWVWAASDQNVLEIRAVTLGDYDEDLASYQVLEGLDEEDYITVPSEELTEGLPVIYNDVSSDVSGEDLYGDPGMDDMDMDDLDALDEGMSIDGISDDGYIDEEIYDDGSYMDEGIYDDGSYMEEGVYDEGGYAEEGVYDEGGFAEEGVYDEGGYVEEAIYDDSAAQGEDIVDVYDADAQDGLVYEEE